MKTRMVATKVLAGAAAGAAMLMMVPGASAEGITIGVGELQECTISKSMDMASTTLAQYAINGNSPAGGGEISFTGLEAPAADGDVDGRDFLTWQRGGRTAAGGDLADWQANYGSTGY